MASPPRPSRRTLLAALTLPGLVLSGCGFALRQPLKLPFSALQWRNPPQTPVAQALTQALQQAGVQVGPLPPPAPGAAAVGVVMEVLADRRERSVVGQTAAGQVRELALRTRFRFNLRQPNGRVLIDDTELLLERDISFSETAVLSKDAEERLLYLDMQRDIVDLVMRRLAALR